MYTWTPLFSKIVDSSVWAEPDHVVKVFLTMMALKDADHVVRYNAFGLAQRAHKTEKEVLDALKILSSPDRTRIEPQPHDGRRIEKVEGVGWRILNGQHYEDLMRSVNRRAYKAAKAREYRLKEKQREQELINARNSKPLPGEEKFVKAIKEGDQDAADRVVTEHLPTAK